MKHYIAGNWKMNKGPKEAGEFASELANALKGNDKVKVMIGVPFVSLESVTKAVKGSNIVLAAQNVSTAESGAYTGEISVGMLKEIGVQSVIIGHSERRALYKEDDYLISRKVDLTLKHDLEVVLCIGETLEQRKAGLLQNTLKIQLAGGLAGVSAQQMSKVVIAYEPVWAIGTGEVATPEQAEEAHEFTRSVIAKLYSKEVAEKVCIQYGGSVNPSNAKGLLSKPNINGALVGGASLKVADFKAIIDSV